MLVAVVAAVQVRVDAKNAQQQLQRLSQTSSKLNGGFKTASTGAQGLGAAIKGALAPIIAVSTAVAGLKKSLDTAFARGVAEKRLQNLTGSAQEYETALALAAQSSEKFGISQTQATQSLADVFSRLKGVGFGLKETSQIYDGFNVIAKESGLAGDAAASAFFQLSQALGKGTLNGDEFVTVSEQMPQLLDKIAQTTGRSRGELKEMAADGEITSKVLYDALSGAADASGDLNKKLTDSQKAFNSLTKISDELFNTLGKVFAPVVIKGAEALAWAGQKIADWWDYLANRVLPKALKILEPLIQEMQSIWDSIPWNDLLTVIQNIYLLGIQTILEGLKILVPILVSIVQKVKEIADSPAFKFVAEQVGNVFNALGLTNNRVGEFNNQQKEGVKQAASLRDKFSSLPEDASKATEKLKQFVESAKQGVEALEAQKRNVQDQEEAYKSSMSVVDARLNAESQINSLQNQQLERAYELAGSSQQRLEIAKQIYQNEIEGAKLAYQTTLNQIEVERNALEFKRQGAVIDGQILKARGEILIAEKQSVEAKKAAQAEVQKALNSQMQAVRLIDNQIKSQAEVAVYQKQAAEAQFKSAELTARQNLEQKLVSEEIGLTQSQAVNLSNKLSEGVTNSQNLSTGMGQVKNNTEQTGTMMIRVATEADRAATSIARAAAAQRSLNAAKAQGGGGGGAQGAANGAYWPGGFQAFAKGGMVTGPTLGLIGEGGEPEYIIPQSKAAGFAANYLSGQRGAGAIPAFADGGYVAPSSASVNIQTGPVTQMNGTNYVTTQDLSRAVQAGVNQTLDLIRRDSSIRTSLGMV